MLQKTAMGLCKERYEMPEKDPSNWVALWSALPESFKAALFAVFVAFVRVMYDGKEPRMARRLLECVLCGAITLAVSALANALGVHADYSTFAGGAIGLLGADHARNLARRISTSKAGKI